MRILLVEDDRSLAMAIEYRLKKAGFEVSVCPDGNAGLAAAEGEYFDLMLLDRMLPGIDGASLVKRMRAANNQAPVLMLTAMDGIGDRVSGLDAGADDYLVKPFAMEELLARIRALSRRQAQWTPRDVLTVGDVTFDAERYALTCGEHAVTLSRREARLLEVLLRNQGQVLPRAVLLDRVWSDTVVEDGNLDIYIHFLRKHLAGIKSRVQIRTARGVGYQLVARE